MFASVLFGSIIVSSANPEPGEDVFEAIGFTGNHYLESPFEGSQKIVVPYETALYKCYVVSNTSTTIKFTFLKSGIEKLERVTIELWWFGYKYEPTCLVASVGKNRIAGFNFERNVVYESTGTIKSLRKVGTWSLKDKTVTFQIPGIKKKSPAVAICRWLPTNLYEKERRYFWISATSILLFGDLKSIVTPCLR